MSKSSITICQPLFFLTVERYKSSLVDRQCNGDTVSEWPQTCVWHFSNAISCYLLANICCRYEDLSVITSYYPLPNINNIHVCNIFSVMMNWWIQKNVFDPQKSNNDNCIILTSFFDRCTLGLKKLTWHFGNLCSSRTLWN